MPHVGSYVELARRTELDLVQSFLAVSQSERANPEIWQGAQTCASFSRESAAALDALHEDFEERRRRSSDPEPDRFWSEPVVDPRTGPVGMVRDLQDLLMLVALAESTWTVLDQAAKALRDERLVAACDLALGSNKRQRSWVTTQLKVTSPQVLLVAP